MMILTGCAKTSAKIVKVDSFCSGKYEPLRSLDENDFNNIAAMRQTPAYKITWDKITKNLSMNEKEFKQCPNLANPPAKN